ncbi:MAG: hypothetical protein LBB67_06975, partial [Oscillospiraceae bacterium]|nr:hypothetical protein [Oscillospiraceae bacterium]
HRTSNTDCTDAVRVGLVFASGKYVSFACADSIFEPKHYETLCFCAVKSDAQVVEIGGERTLLQMIREPQRIDPMGKLIDRAFLADRQIFDQQDFQPHAAYFFARCVAFADRLAFADIPFPPCQTETPVTLDFCAALLRLTQTQDINQLANAWIAVLQDEILRLYTQTRGGKAFFERMIALADKDIMRQILRYADKTTEIGAFVRQRDWISLENCIKKQRAMQLAKRMLKKGR